jgi:methylated-DNA-[protein]-cysteine S-methyltransferase
VAAAMLASPEAFAADLDRRRLGAVLPIAEAPPGPARDLAIRARDGVEAYLAGEPVALEDFAIDLADRSAWDRLVTEGVRSIQRGEVASYGEVASRIGRTGAARAVGGAVGRNPVGLLVPCHRVIAGDGSLGGYGVAAWGGREAALDVKRGLLAIEGVHVG